MTETDFNGFFDGIRLSNLRRNVRRWYAAHGRNLPWRGTRDAYRVWISEIMLQQTTVAVVTSYYHRFLKRFPTVKQLAAADEQAVLRLWEGLGYYSRARNIHKTARRLVNEYNGRFPASVDELQELPGIGRYTAGAIAGFALDQPAPIVEANTLRLYCRLLGYDGDPRSTEGQKLLWSFASRIVPRKSPGDFNHALMDLGATICRPSDPQCPRCPLKTFCRACAEGTVHTIPAAAKRPEMTAVTEVALVVRKNGRVLLLRRQPGERWAGLWDFPRCDVNGNAADAEGTTIKAESTTTGRTDKTTDQQTPETPQSQTLQRTAEAHLKETTGIDAEVVSPLDEIRHSVTRYRIRLLCFLGRHRGGRLKRSADLKWVPTKQLDDYPLSVSGRKIARLLAEVS